MLSRRSTPWEQSQIEVMYGLLQPLSPGEPLCLIERIGNQIHDAVCSESIELSLATQGPFVVEQHISVISHGAEVPEDGTPHLQRLRGGDLRFGPDDRLKLLQPGQGALQDVGAEAIRID